MAYGGHIEAGGNNLAIAPGNHLAHFLVAFVDEEDQKFSLRMVDRDAFYDRLEEHGFSGPGRSDDERALAVADGRDQVDGAAGQLGSALGRTSRLELQFPLGI